MPTAGAGIEPGTIVSSVFQVISRMFKVTFESGETVLEQDSLPTDDDCLYMLDTGEVDIVIAGSGEAANTNQEERKVQLLTTHASECKCWKCCTGSAEILATFSCLLCWLSVGHEVS